MLSFEIKKVISKPINKIVLLVLSAIIVLACFLTIKDVKYITASGTTITGISASKKLRESKNEWKGNIDEDTLEQVIDKHYHIMSSAEATSDNIEENDSAFAKLQGIDDIVQLINLSFGEFENFDYFRINTVTKEEVGNFYKNRISNLQNWLNSDDVENTFSEEEKQFLISQYSQLETPLYYEYTDGWKALLDSQFLPTLTMILVLIIAFLVSGIFSDEFQLKTDSIFFSSKLGRNKAVISKIKAGLLITTTIYWISIATFTLFVLGSLGFEGSNSAIQIGMSNWDSFYNISYLENYFITVLGAYVGCLFIAIISMFISAKARSSVLAIVIPFVLICLPPFIGRIEFFSRMMALFPDQLLRISKSLEDFIFYQIGNTVFGLVSVIIPLYSILFFIFIPILYMVYRKLNLQ